MAGRMTMMLGIALLCAVAAAGQVCDLGELDTTTAPGAPTHTVLVGPTAYAAAGAAGIVRVDTTNPSNLGVIGTTASEGTALDIAYEYFGNQLVVADGDAGISTYALPAGGPQHLATLDVGGTVTALAGNAGSYLAGSQQGVLYTVAIDGSGQPTVQGQVNLSGQVVDLIEHSRTAYCALGTGNAVAVVDMENRAAPALVDVYNLSGAARSVARSGDLILVGVEGQGIVVFEQQDDRTLEQVSTLQLAGTPTEIEVFNGRVFAVGPQLGLVEADSTLGTALVQIGELPLAGATGVALAGDVAYIGRGGAGFSSADVSDCANSQSGVTASFIPAGARAPGASGSFWLTDAAVANFSTDVAVVNISYLAKNQSNTSPVNASLALGPGEQIILGDVFNSLLGYDSANGGLMITASHADVMITSRTYNAAGQEGTYGQFIPAAREAAAATQSAPGALIQLQENDGFRTNIGLVNTGDAPVEVVIHLYSGSGAQYGTVSRTLLPYEMTQFDRIFNRVNAGVVSSGYAVVEVLTDGAVLAYASVVDNGSNDPIYIPAQRLTTGLFSFK